MRVDTVWRTGGAAGTAAARRVAGGFALPPDGAESRHTAPAASGPLQLASLDGILALQDIGEQGGRRRRSLRRGHELLDRLESLRLGLLSGGIDVEALSRVMDLLAVAGDSGDPALDAVLADIELRAHVELAKLGRFVP